MFKGLGFLEKCFQFFEDGMLRSVSLDHDHIFELLQLLLQLGQSVIFLDSKPDTGLLTIADGQTEDAIHIEGSPGKQTGNVRHDAGVIVNAKL